MKYDLKRLSRQAASQESNVYLKEWMKQIAKNLLKR
jgi:hypothetical protein